MSDFDAIVDELSSPDEDNNVAVTICTLGIPPEALSIPCGTTVKDLKAMQGLEGTKFVDEYGNALRDSDVIDEDTKIFTATAKKNG